MNKHKRVWKFLVLTLPVCMVLVLCEPFHALTPAIAYFTTDNHASIAPSQVEDPKPFCTGLEACLDSYGSKTAFAMGISEQNLESDIHTLPDANILVSMSNGGLVSIPVGEYVIQQDYTMYANTTYPDPATGKMVQNVSVMVIPAQTKIWTHPNGVEGLYGTYLDLGQVKTLVTMPFEQSARLSNGTMIQFDTIASYAEAGADINSETSEEAIAAIAKAWINACFEALALDGANNP